MCGLSQSQMESGGTAQHAQEVSNFGSYPNWVHCVLRFSIYTRSRDLGT